MAIYNRVGLLLFGGLFGVAGAYYMVCAMWLVSIGLYPVTSISVVAMANSLAAIVMCVFMVFRYVAVRNM